MKLLESEKAISEVIGHVLILGLTVIGVSVITVFSMPVIFNLQEMANAKNIEQTYAILDSRASTVIFGSSPVQVANVNLGEGSLTVEPDSSYIVITNTGNTFNITKPMGSVKYSLGDRIVAYEGVYLEVGTFNGYSLLSAALFNPKTPLRLPNSYPRNRQRRRDNP